MDYTTQMLSENVMRSALDSSSKTTGATTELILWSSLAIVAFISLAIYIYIKEKD